MWGYFTWNNLVTVLRAIIDIACIWTLFYYCLKYVRNNSRTIQIFKGVVIVVVSRFISNLLGLATLTSLIDMIMTWGVVAIIIIFQPEIRSALEKMGKTSFFTGTTTLSNNEKENLVNELVKACGQMSSTKTGALISIEQSQSLNDYIRTGTRINAEVSAEILGTIFQYGTPLHDGAVIIQGVKIACAAAYFPPTTIDLDTTFGARHRAAIGISEISDSITIVVSEESGKISVAQGGQLTTMSLSELREFLYDAIVASTKKEENEDNNKRFSFFKKKENKKQVENTVEEVVEETNDKTSEEIVLDENTVVLHYESDEEGSDSHV